MLQQSAGLLITDYLNVDGTYRLTGGTFQVLRSLTVGPNGVIDLGGGSSEFTAGRDSILDLPASALNNTANATLRGESGSLIQYPAGYNPFAHFASVSTDGLLHESGTPLAIPSGGSVTGEGSITGKVTNHGKVNPGYGVESSILFPTPKPTSRQSTNKLPTGF